MIVVNKEGLLKLYNLQKSSSRLIQGMLFIWFTHSEPQSNLGYMPWLELTWFSVVYCSLVITAHLWNEIALVQVLVLALALPFLNWRLRHVNHFLPQFPHL